ncbi:hypothetical protein [Psittacicella hinzii]|uniref:Uncharacterized protein n=1 Tax=Psittacicella hinzii TaxID=2028575 RepID=A0A3A1YKG3_9GAMM|nr:hypothetical protein [Psittacicella hinzii]RIY38753.1 hypothetical protein CKF58_03490 [Psittacicella hinzii]
MSLATLSANSFAATESNSQKNTTNSEVVVVKPHATNPMPHKYQKLIADYQKMSKQELAQIIDSQASTDTIHDFQQINAQLRKFLKSNYQNRSMNYKQYMRILFMVFTNINLRYNLTAKSYSSESMQQFVNFYLACKTSQNKGISLPNACQDAMNFGALMLDDVNFMETVGLLSLYQGFMFNAQKGNLTSDLGKKRFSILKHSQQGLRLSRDFNWQVYTFRQYYERGQAAIRYLQRNYGINLVPNYDKQETTSAVVEFPLK